MEINDIIQNEYFDKIILTLIPLILKGLLGKDSEVENTKKYIRIAVNYLLPIGTIIWINLDKNIEINKLTATLIAFNFALLIFNYWQQQITDNYKIVQKFSEVETDKIKQINHVNEVQIEKVKAINDNQKYILEELSKINDRIITYIGKK